MNRFEYEDNNEDYIEINKNWSGINKANSNTDYVACLLEKSALNLKKRAKSEAEESDGPSALQEESESEQQSEHEVAVHELDDGDASGEGEDFDTLFDADDNDNVHSCEPWLDDIAPQARPNPAPFLSLPIPTPTMPAMPVVESKATQSAESKAAQSAELGLSANSKRRDVCIKSILRSMRRYYCSKLETMTQYLRKEKKIKLKHQTLIRCAQEIVTQLGLKDFSPNMAFYFSLFSYSCDMRKILEKSKQSSYYLNCLCECSNKSLW